MFNPDAQAFQPGQHNTSSTANTSGRDNNARVHRPLIQFGSMTPVLLPYPSQASTDHHSQGATIYDPPAATIYDPPAATTYHHQAGTPYHPQAGTPLRPQAGTPYHPQAIALYHTQAGTAYHPQASTAYHPQAGPAYHPQAGTPYHLQASTPYHPQAGTPFSHPAAMPLSAAGISVQAHLDHYANIWPENAGKQSAVLEQKRHAKSFKSFDMSPDVEMAEKYEGALATVRTLNPDFFQLHQNTCIINAKGEFDANVIHAVQSGRWCTSERSSGRIMEAWRARKSSSDKILLLFSVNCTQQYCALAEVSGPWDPVGFVEGWTERSQGAKVAGSFPVTMIYLKNVPFSNFANIQQNRNNHSVLNMWDGMRFDSAAGREVVRVYVEHPHFANMIAWPKLQNQTQTPQVFSFDWQLGTPQTTSSLVDHFNGLRSAPASYPSRGRGMPFARGTGRGFTHAIDSGNWRDRADQAPHNTNISGAPPLQRDNPTLPCQSTAGATKAAISTHLDGTAETTSTPHPGQYVSCTFNQQSGEYVPTPAGPYPRVTCLATVDGQYVPLHPSSRKPAPSVTLPEHERSIKGTKNAKKSPYNTTESKTGVPVLARSPFVQGKTVQRAWTRQQQQEKQKRMDAAGSPLPPQLDVFGQPKKALPSDLSSNYTAVGRHRGITQFEKWDVRSLSDDCGFETSSGSQAASAVPRASSTASYPSTFDGIDSMAGVNPRAYLPVRARPLEATPTRASSDKSQTIGQKMAMWDENTPIRPSFGTTVTGTFAYPVPVDHDAGQSVPLSKRPSFFYLKAEDARVKKTLASMKFSDDEEEYYRTMAKQAEIERQIQVLTYGDVSDSEGGGNSVSAYSERMGSGSQWSWSSDIQRNVDNIVNSPPASRNAAPRVQVQPVSPKTNPFSDDGSEAGGARLW